jgi:hypothetical protein
MLKTDTDDQLAIACLQDIFDLQKAAYRASLIRTPANVVTKTCKINPSVGAEELTMTWPDPHYDAARRAFYYDRVLEEPTCRWSTYESNMLGKPVRKGLLLTIQERAWSPPIWVHG